MSSRATSSLIRSHTVRHPPSSILKCNVIVAMTNGKQGNEEESSNRISSHYEQMQSFQTPSIETYGRSRFDSPRM